MRYPSSNFSTAFILCTLGVGGLAHAQNAPNDPSAAAAGYLSQELDKQLPLTRPKEIRSAPLETVEPTSATNSDQAFFLKGIVLSGFNKVPFSELLEQVKGYQNLNVDLKVIEKICNQITLYIRSKGYIVQVFAPPQEVKDGILRLEITQANLGGVNFSDAEESTPLQDSASAKMRSQSRAASYIFNQVPSGGVVDLNALDRAIVILNDQSSRSYLGTLKQGLEQGQTDLDLESNVQDTVVGGVDVNNYGVQSTGRGQAIGQVAIRDLLGLDESISLGAIASQGTSYFKLGYTMPLAANGLRLSLDLSTLNYRTVGSAATPANGDSRSGSIQFSYPVFASKEGISRLYVGASSRQFNNYTYQSIVSSYSLGSMIVGMSGNFFDSLLLPSSNIYNISILNGHGNYGNSPSTYQKYYSNSGQLISYVPAGYTKLNAFYAKSFFIGEQSNLRAALTGQLASANLNSAENFYVTGADAVRAYMPSVAYGTQGFMANIDYTYEFLSGIGLGAFYDYATVKQYKSSTNIQMINSYTAPNSYSVSGAGLKASYRYQNRATASVFVAKPLDDVAFPSLLASGGKPAYVVGAQAQLKF